MITLAVLKTRLLIIVMRLSYRICIRLNMLDAHGSFAYNDFIMNRSAYSLTRLVLTLPRPRCAR